jgi:hypothetical protein
MTARQDGIDTRLPGIAGTSEFNSRGTAKATFEPASRVASVRLLWLTMADIQSSETVLVALYRQHLPAIRAAAK